MSGNRAGAVLMLLGMAAFAMNDTLGKWLVADYGVAQVILLRSLAAGLMMAPFLMRGGQVLRRIRSAPRPRLQVLRAVCTTAEVFFFYLAVLYMPLADVMAFWMAAPIYVVAISALVLRERIAARTWIAVTVGFLGMLILLAPTVQMSVAGVTCAMLGTFAFAAMMILGRSLRETPDRDLVLFQISAAALAGLLLVPFDWQPIQSGGDLALLFLLGIVATCAHMLVTRALKMADASAVAPLQYSLLVWGMALGFAVFGDVPAAGMLVGGGLIVTSGLIVMRTSSADGAAVEKADARGGPHHKAEASTAPRS